VRTPLKIDFVALNVRLHLCSNRRRRLKRLDKGNRAGSGGSAVSRLISHLHDAAPLAVRGAAGCRPLSCRACPPASRPPVVAAWTPSMTVKDALPTSAARRSSRPRARMINTSNERRTRGVRTPLGRRVGVWAPAEVASLSDWELAVSRPFTPDQRCGCSYICFATRTTRSPHHRERCGRT